MRLAILLLYGSGLWAQPRQPDVAAQRAAMKKLEYLVGNWAGDATVMAGPGKTLAIRQSEKVEWRLDGLLLLIEGTGRDEAGKVVFQALGVVNWDEEKKAFRMRAFRDGREVDTALEVEETGFTWGFAAGPAKVVNRMVLNAEGEWVETTKVQVEGGREFQSVQMRLKRQ